jgi:2-polyprenyl-6-methoxyphenol hydroxylase-like FAD-dependent oxidoreductase
MPNGTYDTDVLIVGAGPVGLLLANECARRGLQFRIVERNATQSEHSKALAIFPRTLEIFDMAGIAAPFLEAANRVTALSVVTGGRTLAHMQFVLANSHSFVAMVPQDVTERLLVEALHGKGGSVEYQTSFLSAVEQDGSVRATLEHNGERQTISARFLVGCDGAHSTVRQGLDLPFEGGEYREGFMLADVETNETLPASEMHLCPNSQGPLAIFPMSATRRRIVAMIEEPEGDAPSLDLTRRLLAERGPQGIEARSLHWSGYFHIHHRRVSKLRAGRVFIAGDAAHIHSPFGGQGMNTGLHDVWNLAWKLDLFLRGHGNEALLDSYTAERIPVIKGVVDLTDFMTRAMGTPSRLAEALRDTVIPVVSRLTPFQHAFVQRLSGLEVAYSGSPIVEGAGQRYMDESMRGGGILSRFLLMLDRNAPASVVENAKRLAASQEVVECRLADHSGLTLVRPDGYVAFTSEHARESELDAVRLLLERQTA